MSLEHHADDRLSGRKPGLHVFVGSPSDAYDLMASFGRGHEPKSVARIIRGAKARTSRALFDECAAAWQFPPYFGENWDALDECLADLEWLPAPAYAFVVNDAVQALGEEKPEAFDTLISLLAAVARDRSRTTPGAAFHVILQASPEEESTLIDRLTRAGAPFDRL